MIIAVITPSSVSERSHIGKVHTTLIHERFRDLDQINSGGNTSIDINLDFEDVAGFVEDFFSIFDKGGETEGTRAPTRSPPAFESKHQSTEDISKLLSKIPTSTRKPSYKNLRAVSTTYPSLSPSESTHNHTRDPEEQVLLQKSHVVPDMVMSLNADAPLTLDEPQKRFWEKMTAGHILNELKHKNMSSNGILLETLGVEVELENDGSTSKSSVSERLRSINIFQFDVYVHYDIKEMTGTSKLLLDEDIKFAIFAAFDTQEDTNNYLQKLHDSNSTESSTFFKVDSIALSIPQNFNSLGSDPYEQSTRFTPANYMYVLTAFLTAALVFAVYTLSARYKQKASRSDGRNNATDIVSTREDDTSYDSTASEDTAMSVQKCTTEKSECLNGNSSSLKDAKHWTDNSVRIFRSERNIYEDHIISDQEQDLQHTDKAPRPSSSPEIGISTTEIYSSFCGIFSSDRNISEVHIISDQEQDLQHPNRAPRPTRCNSSPEIGTSTTAYESSMEISCRSELEQQSFVSECEEIIHVYAPAGKLGFFLDTSNDFNHTVHSVSESSPIFKKLEFGDKLIAIDDKDVKGMSSRDVSRIIREKMKNPQRKLSIVRSIRNEE
eukprot:CAMPEP_0194346354 /NCGR_PEP_ID=MMETSP0171-20130528/105378_1 /TAXON_ID=218684 /ORGANISM="Corethron pennatum, Strain L29A3" /LENGTH=607 /DNA_ID=CAMNT_0039113465 /DNA_START=216 /DNA_END=2036 /DNA_ORIENTATION=-